MTNLKVSIGNITFNNPIWVASGTFGYGTEAPELIDVNKLGAIVTKSITRQPREGNPPPRIVETPSGMINSIGLANIGVEKYIKEMLPIYEDLSTKIIMNIRKISIDNDPVIAAQPIIGGKAPAAHPITIFWGVLFFNQIV